MRPSRWADDRAPRPAPSGRQTIRPAISSHYTRADQEPLIHPPLGPHRQVRSSFSVVPVVQEGHHSSPLAGRLVSLHRHLSQRADLGAASLCSRCQCRRPPRSPARGCGPAPSKRPVGPARSLRHRLASKGLPRLLGRRHRARHPQPALTLPALASPSTARSSRDARPADSARRAPCAGPASNRQVEPGRIGEGRPVRRLW